jgi:hypothetical protein
MPFVAAWRHRSCVDVDMRVGTASRLFVLVPARKSPFDVVD